MRILLVTYYYPPDSEVGALRPSRLARFLAQAGHEVHVLTMANAPGAEGVVARDGITIHRVKAWRSPRSIVKSMFSSGDGPAKASPSADEGTPRRGSGSETTNGFRRAFLSALWFPDDKQGFVGPAVATGADLIARLSIEIVYVTGPPWSVHLAGMLLRDLSGAPLVVEYRDPWSPVQAVDSLNHEFFVNAKRSLQQKVLRRADLVVTATAGIATYVRPFVTDPIPFLTVLNGMAPAVQTPPTERPSGPIRIVHAGEVYLGRDPEPLFRSLAVVVKARRLDPSQLRIQFLGHGRDYRGVSVEGIANAAGIREFVEFQDQVPYDECQRILREADALLLLAQLQPLQVPNKLYDYLAARRPVIGFVDAGGESERILRRLVGHSVVTDWFGSEASAAIEAVIDTARSAVLPANEPFLLGLRSDAQFGALVEHLEQIGVRGRRTIREYAGAGAPGRPGAGILAPKNLP